MSTLQRLYTTCRVYSRLHPAALALAIVLFAGTTQRAQAQRQFRLLYSFQGVSVGDGAGPAGGLVRDDADNIFGTTEYGGDPGCDCGIVFKVDSSGGETVLHRFKGTPDGADPYAGLVRDEDGNLYGTTYLGGDQSCNCGTVFKVDNTGKESVLYRFIGGTDGAYPSTGLIRDAAGNLYGTTVSGGASATSCFGSGCGTVFKVDATGEEKVLYRFTGVAGAQPNGLVRDAVGNFYGTTVNGGSSNIYPCNQGCGTVFKLDALGNEILLYIFSGHADGRNPRAGVVLDEEGNLYGTALGGADGYGNVFKVDSNGRQTVLYSFTKAVDGAYPYAGLVRDPAGNLYGVTSNGGIGNSGYGTVFKLGLSSDIWSEMILHRFTRVDGAYPLGALIRDAVGTLYGATSSDGPFNSGTLFELAR